MVSSLLSATGPAAKRNVVPEGERMVKVRLGNLLRPEICTTMGKRGKRRGAPSAEVIAIVPARVGSALS